MKAVHGRFIVGALLLVVACAARAQDFGAPVLLVAAPGTQGAYSRTAMIAVPVSGGHAGVILNRSGNLDLASVLPGNPQAAKVVAPVRFGGPLGSKLVYAMVRRDPGEGAKRLLGDVFMTTGAATIDRIVERMPEDARFFTGMVVWLPGELETQIEAGEWIVMDPDASVVFHRNPEAMWDELVARRGKPALTAQK
jgi:putative transcriptional regulator